jgi:hypothetical protein
LHPDETIRSSFLCSAGRKCGTRVAAAGCAIPSEILRYRARKTAESEQRKEQHGRQMIAMDQKIREAMSRSPWVSVPGEAGKSAQRAYPAAARKKGLRTRVIYRWIFSVTALLLIGCCVWWVRGATKPDER